MNKLTGQFLALLLLTLPTLVFAQSDRRPDRPLRDDDGRIGRLERSVHQLERENSNLHQRLSRIEDILRDDHGGGGGPYPPPANEIFACMLVDSGYTKTFLAEGRSVLDAEYNVKQKCGQSVHASYCNGGRLECDSNKNSRARGYVCMITDSGYSKSFRGEGPTSLSAEANAKISCQSSVHPSYCGNIQPRCEEIR